MKSNKYLSIAKHAIAGIALGFCMVRIALIINQKNGYKGTLSNIFDASPDFYLIASMPIILCIVFCYVSYNKQQLLKLNAETNESLELEKQLHETIKEKLNETMLNANIGSWEVDYLDGTHYLSPELRRIYSIPLNGNISLEETYKNIHSEDIGVLEEKKKQCASTLQPVEVEYRYIINGDIRYMKSTLTPRLNRRGKFKGFFGTVKDITKTKLAELALKRSEEEKAAVLNNTHALICTHDLNGVILTVNDAAVRMTGFTKEELIGLNIKSLVSTPYQHLFADYLVEIKEKKSSKGDMPITMKSGENRMWIYQNTMHVNSDNVEYVIASAVDVTESVTAKVEMEKQEQIIRQIIDNSPNVIFVLDEQQNIILANKTFAKYYSDYNDNETFYVSDICKNSKTDIFLADIDNTLILDDGNIVKTEGSIMNNETESLHYFNVIKKVFTEANGQKYVLGFGMDITDRHKTEQDLKAANEMVERSLKVKEQFIANMSHEIRTPLNAVIGFTDLLAETHLNKDQAEYIDIVKTASQNLLALINNILDLSKIESGNIALECLPMDVTKIVTDIKKIFEPKAKTKGIALNVSFLNDIPEKVMGDQLRLSQIIYNLLGNAVKFTNEGSIDINCKLVKGSDTNKNYISFSIKDTGIGVPLDKQNDIFERFTQAGPDTQRLYGGSGLGLNIVKSIVDMQGGTLSMESTPEEGTTFRFILPFKKYQETEILHEVKTSEGYNILSVNSNKPIKVLLAEDNSINAMLAIEVLSKKGFLVDHVINGKLAVENVKANKYDVVLMDIQMPELNGIEATQAIRKLEGDASLIPIIAMTAHSLHGEMQNCYSAGMSGYVSKPFKPDDLFSAIIDVVNNNKAPIYVINKEGRLNIRGIA